MQFFDYDEDLRIFNALMEAKKKADPATAGSGNSAATSKPSDPKKSAADDKFKQSTITNKIKDNLNKSEKLNYKLFCATYWPEKYSQPFQLGKAGNYIVMNDPSVKDPPVKLTDNTHISINLSALINKKTRRTMAKKLVGIQDLAAFAADQNTPYSEARAYIINENLSKWLETVLDPDYEAKQREKQAKKEARQKAKEEQNKQGNTEENNPQDQQQQNPQDQQQQNPQDQQQQNPQDQQQQNPQDQQQKNPQDQQQQNPQDQQQQNPQDQQKSQNQQGQNGPDTPSDEDNPNALYKKIRKNFQENYKEDMMIDCKNQAGSLDDDGKDALVDKYYDMAMEDFPDVYDDDVQQRVQDLIASYVDLYTKTNDNQQNQQNKNPDDPDEDEFNFDPNKKKKNPNGQDDGDNDQSNNNDGSAPGNSNGKHGYGYFNWLNNTLKHWDQSGVTNRAANPKPGVEHADYTVKQATNDWLAGRRARKGIKSTNTHKKTDNQNVDKIIDED